MTELKFVIESQVKPDYNSGGMSKLRVPSIHYTKAKWYNNSAGLSASRAHFNLIKQVNQQDLCCQGSREEIERCNTDVWLPAVAPIKYISCSQSNFVFLYF